MHPQREHGQTFLREGNTTVPSTAATQYNVGAKITITKSPTHLKLELGQIYLRMKTTTVPPIPRAMSFAGDMMAITKLPVSPSLNH